VDRSLEGRKAMGVIAYIPRLVLLGDPWGASDDKLVCDLCPKDHDLRLWCWFIEQAASRVFGTQGFLEAFGVARDRIEERLA
jgi:hypothetical protein